MRVFVLGGDDDEHAVHIVSALGARGVEADLLDSRQFPGEVRIAWDPVAGEGRIALPGAAPVEFSEIHSVYWRCYNGQAASPLADDEQAELAVNDARSLFESLLTCLPARWVNGWDAFQLHQTKPAALARVAAMDLPSALRCPATCLGNDPEAIRNFVARHDRCIFKPVQGGAHTRRVTPAHLTDENLRSLASAPVTLQEHVDGTDVRVFVADSRALACEIHTDETDFRDDPGAEIVAVDLPADVAAACVAIARELHLMWTGIDLRRTDEGQFVFLEANPSPMFIGFETYSGLPLTDALLDVLTA